MQPAPAIHFAHPAFRGWAGVAECEHTPPEGVYNRLWGAAIHDTASGIHHPLRIKALALRESPTAPPLLYLTLEVCLLRDPEDRLIRSSIANALGISDAARVIVHCTHSHGSVPFTVEFDGKPGAALLVDWCRTHIKHAADTALRAVENCVPAELAWEPGRCELAAQRDFPVPGDAHGKIACGFNPGSEPDRTLLVGRLADHETGSTLAVLAHYACHPTTLAWKNRRISPDFIGAAAALVREHHNCPLFFMQGASGELAPRRQYTGDPALADQNGRVLGYAILSLLENMLPPGCEMHYQGVLTSGADLGIWEMAGRNASPELRVLKAWQTRVALPLLPRPSLDELHRLLQHEQETPIRERLERQILREETLKGADQFEAPVFFWRVGETCWIAQSQETYSLFQTGLRRAFPGATLLPMNVANGPHLSYLYPRELGGKPIYQVEVSVFAPGALEILMDHCRDQIEQARKTPDHP